MIDTGIVTIVLLLLTFLIAWPLGLYIARVLEDEGTFPSVPPLAWLERGVAKMLGSSWTVQMGWKEYFFSFLALNSVGIFLLFVLLRWQSVVSFGEGAQGNFAPFLAFNTAVSFVTNTNWQAYVPETSMSWSTQMIALTVQQFVSAASGVTLLCVIARAFVRSGTTALGNFWRDLVRSLLYILLPLSTILAIGFLATGVPQSIKGSLSYTTLEGASETVPIGMCASQKAISLLGTNGGGFFQANSAHPFDNPSPIANVLSFAAILLLPMALCRTFGEQVRAPRQGMLFVLVMGSLLLTAVLLACASEGGHCFEIHIPSSLFEAQGNMEGKECRFGPFWSVLWAVEATATSNGSMNCAVGSLFPLSAGVALALMELGEVVFGGLGTGLVGAILFLLISVFSAGLMVGRTPEYLCKKIEAREMKAVIVFALVPAVITLIATAAALSSPTGRAALSIQSSHGLTEVLYAYSSTAVGNGSSIASLRADVPFYLIVTSIVMYLGRMVPAALILSLAGALVEKKHVAESAGTLRTDSLAFGLWFAFVIVMLGALNFLPALTLGPVIEHLTLFQCGGA